MFEDLRSYDGDNCRSRRRNSPVRADPDLAYHFARLPVRIFFSECSVESHKQMGQCVCLGVLKVALNPESSHQPLYLIATLLES